MRIHHLQHVPFEGLGSIEPHLLKLRHQLTSTHLYRSEPLPEIDAFDALIVMGGPKGVMDHADYPWLQAELDFISRAIATGKKVLGICLGAQLIATALGANVYRNSWREIGWWPVTRACASGSFELLPENYMPFHWHGDTFDLPSGAVHLARSEACPHQAFALDNRVIALQFHLETTPEVARDLIRYSGDELDGSRFVQTAEQMLAGAERFATSNSLMASLLDSWLGGPPG